ncbi:hypothetical protein NMY22_g4364 [Coprinellus aureogranulatus]|nr:hypothetical protein NMY22_g4364 [Coprinellus aureogranulatus]
MHTSRRPGTTSSSANTGSIGFPPTLCRRPITCTVPSLVQPKEKAAYGSGDSSPSRSRTASKSDQGIITAPEHRQVCELPHARLSLTENTGAWMEEPQARISFERPLPPSVAVETGPRAEPCFCAPVTTKRLEAEGLLVSDQALMLPWIAVCTYEFEYKLFLQLPLHPCASQHDQHRGPYKSAFFVPIPTIDAHISDDPQWGRLSCSLPDSPFVPT